MRPHIRRTACLFVLAAVLVGAVAAQAGQFEKKYKFDCEELVLLDLIGEVQVVAAKGDDFEVLVQVKGGDADEDLITFEIDEGRKTEFVIGFPLDKHQSYIYPALGSHSNSSINARSWLGGEDSGWLDRIGLGKKSQIKVSGKGRGLELWADVTIKVPAGKTVEARVGVGTALADKVKGDVTLDTSSGAIEATGIRGSLVCDTGSGSVTVTDCQGDLISADTGSGGVEVRNVECKKLNVDTGSGGVECRGVSADSARLDTGSGGVDLYLDRMGKGRFVIDTGSGSISLILPKNASAEITADTGSGRVRADVNDAKVHKKSRDYISLTVGDGDARVILDAGSGSITIEQE